MIGPAEAQRIHVSDGPSAHREDVTQDPANSRRGALIGLDVGRVVVALHLEDGGVAIADVDDPGILSRVRRSPTAPRSAASSGERARICSEQCSDHMTEKMPSSTRFGSRPRAFRMRSYSSGARPCSATIWGVMRGASITSMRGPLALSVKRRQRSTTGFGATPPTAVFEPRRRGPQNYGARQ